MNNSFARRRHSCRRDGAGHAIDQSEEQGRNLHLLMLPVVFRAISSLSEETTDSKSQVRVDELEVSGYCFCGRAPLVPPSIQPWYSRRTCLDRSTQRRAVSARL